MCLLRENFIWKKFAFWRFSLTRVLRIGDWWNIFDWKMFEIKKQKWYCSICYKYQWYWVCVGGARSVPVLVCELPPPRRSVAVCWQPGADTGGRVPTPPSPIWPAVNESPYRPISFWHARSLTCSHVYLCRLLARSSCCLLHARELSQTRVRSCRQSESLPENALGFLHNRYGNWSKFSRYVHIYSKSKTLIFLIKQFSRNVNEEFHTNLKPTLFN